METIRLLAKSLKEIDAVLVPSVFVVVKCFHVVVMLSSDLFLGKEKAVSPILLNYLGVEEIMPLSSKPAPESQNLSRVCWPHMTSGLRESP